MVTKAVEERAILDGMQKDDSGEVRPVSIYGKVFWITAAFGAVLGGLASWAGQPMVGLVLFLMFLALSVPGLCLQYNCRLTYNNEGFVWRDFWRKRHHYSYESVTGLYSSPLRVVVELNGKKRLDLDHAWINRNDFVRVVKKYRSEKPPKLPQPVLGMSADEIIQSYDAGTLARALLVPKDGLPHLSRAKWVHYSICTLAVLHAVFAIFVGPTAQTVDTMTGFILFALPGLLLMALTLALYFRYPQYFTVREKPGGEIFLSKQKRAAHKCCTIAVVSLFGLPGSVVFILGRMENPAKPLFLWSAVLLSMLVFAGLLALFRQCSWEYRKFGVGYVSYGVWQVLFCASVFFVLGGWMGF